MGIFAVLLEDEDLLFSEDHIKDIKKQAGKMDHRGKGYFHYDRQIALAQHAQNKSKNRPYSFFKDRYRLLLDGVITNLAKLRQLLIREGYHFYENTAEEIIANLYLHKKTRVFSLLEGSFAILIWDGVDRVLLGARDRFGIKQLYYTESDLELMFSSEKKALLFSHYEEEIDTYSFFHYLDYNYIPEPRTMIKGIRQIKKGHYFIKKLKEPLQFIRYNRPSFPRDFRTSDEKLNKGIQSYHEAISSRLNKQGNNGIIFNKSLASLAICGVAKLYDQDLSLFSLRAEGEKSAIEPLARKLQIPHESLSVGPEMFMDELPRIIWLLDDPFASPEAVTYYFLARHARDLGFNSLVSDIGAEAVLGNYRGDRGRFFGLDRLLKNPFRQSSESLIRHEAQFSRSFKQRLLEQIVTVEHDENRFLGEVAGADPFIQRQYTQLKGSLPSKDLRILDKLLSSNKLRLLAPFLDESFFEVMRYQRLEDKRRNTFLLSVLAEVLPTNIKSLKIEEGMPSLPLEDWFRNDCYEWAEALISESQIDYLMSKEQVKGMLKNFKVREREAFQPLWTVFVFIVWHLIYVEGFFPFRKRTENFIGKSYTKHT